MKISQTETAGLMFNWTHLWHIYFVYLKNRVLQVIYPTSNLKLIKKKKVRFDVVLAIVILDIPTVTPATDNGIRNICLE